VNLIWWLIYGDVVLVLVGLRASRRVFAYEAQATGIRKLHVDDAGELGVNNGNKNHELHTFSCLTSTLSVVKKSTRGKCQTNEMSFASIRLGDLGPLSAIDGFFVYMPHPLSYKGNKYFSTSASERCGQGYGGFSGFSGSLFVGGGRVLTPEGGVLPEFLRCGEGWAVESSSGVS